MLWPPDTGAAGAFSPKLSVCVLCMYVMFEYCLFFEYCISYVMFEYVSVIMLALVVVFMYCLSIVFYVYLGSFTYLICYVCRRLLTRI